MGQLEVEEMKRRCYTCGGTKFERRPLEEPIFDGEEFLGTVKVTAWVCLQCGDSYLPHKTMKQLWRERERLKKAKTAATKG